MKREFFHRATATALVMLLVCAFFGTGSASADVADRQAEVERMQAEYAKTVSAAEYDRTVQLYERMLAAESDVESRQVAGGEFCGTIPKEAGIAYGWYLKIIGAVSGVGAVIVGTVSIPAAVAMGAIGMAQGLSGDAVIQWSEHHLPKKICVSWS